MNRPAKLGLALALAATWASVPALADIPPPDVCDEAGEACTNAGPMFDAPGVCFMRTCSKGPPGEAITYDCLRCEKTGEGGAGGDGGHASQTGGKATGGSDTGGNATGGSSSKPPEKDDGSDDGCSIRGVGAERGFAGLMLLSGLALLGRGRRR